jgi:hypothetical protein
MYWRSAIEGVSRDPAGNATCGQYIIRLSRHLPPVIVRTRLMDDNSDETPRLCYGNVMNMNRFSLSRPI